MALFLDTETTGIPARHKGRFYDFNHIKHYSGARVVQVCYALCDAQLNLVEVVDFVIKPEDFKIIPSEYHGITQEMAEEVGVSMYEAAMVLKRMLRRASHVLAHNLDFDMSVLKSELCRDIRTRSVITDLNKKVGLCTMEATKDLVNIRNHYGVKFPSLAETFKLATGEVLQNAHDAKHDVLNMHRATKILVEQGKIFKGVEFVLCDDPGPVIETDEDEDEE